MVKSITSDILTGRDGTTLTTIRKEDVTAIRSQNREVMCMTKNGMAWKLKECDTVEIAQNEARNIAIEVFE